MDHIISTDDPFKYYSSTAHNLPVECRNKGNGKHEGHGNAVSGSVGAPELARVHVRLLGEPNRATRTGHG